LSTEPSPHHFPRLFVLGHANGLPWLLIRRGLPGIGAPDRPEGLQLGIRPVKSAKRTAPLRRRSLLRAGASKPNELDLVLKYWPLTAPLSFLLTNGMLIAIFGRWHLAFMQLVGPADLIIPGFVFGVFAMLVPALSYVTGLIVDAVASAIGKSRQQLAFLAVWIELGFAAHVLYRSSIYEQQRRWRATLILPSLALPTVLTFLWMGLTVDMFAADGMTGGLEMGPTEKLQCRGRVMWMGDKSTIVRCPETPARPERFIVLVGGDRILTPTLANKAKEQKGPPEASRVQSQIGPTP
jgi:hypothetical protein